MSNGLIMVPFIIGVVWMFASAGSFPSKLFTAAGVLIIIAAVIMTTNISLVHITLFEWIVILVLIFGGAGMLARILFAGRQSAETGVSDRERQQIEDTSARIRAIEDELEHMKSENKK